jgi:hypothetical protein
MTPFIINEGQTVNRLYSLTLIVVHMKLIGSIPELAVANSELKDDRKCMAAWRVYKQYVLPAMLMVIICQKGDLPFYRILAKKKWLMDCLTHRKFKINQTNTYMKSYNM